MPTYEFHVLIDPAKEETMDADKMPGWRNTVVEMSTGVARRQPMWTCARVFASDADALAFARESASVCDHVTRIKTERMGPQPGAVEGDEEYLESHVKVNLNGGEYQALAKTCLGYGVQLLVNPNSEQPWPVTTMRRYDVTEESFLKEHNRLVAQIEEQGFGVHRTHIERGIMDTNTATDEGWLFPMGGSHRDLVTTVDCPERLVPPCK